MGAVVAHGSSGGSLGAVVAIGSDTRLLTSSPRFEAGNLSSLQWTANLLMGCHLGWYSTVGGPPRGGRGE
jgi:hypothetical protein